MGGTVFETVISSTCTGHLSKNGGLYILASCTATPPTTADVFAKGCVMLSAANGTYKNIGTSAAPVWALGDDVSLQTTTQTIATTGNTDGLIVVPFAGVLTSAIFYGTTALAANDTNYVTFTITNLGQAGAGTTEMLGAVNGNTTKATGGSAISLATKKTLSISGTAANLVVAAGDLLRVRAAATGTLANTVSSPTYCITLYKTA